MLAAALAPELDDASLLVLALSSALTWAVTSKSPPTANDESSTCANTDAGISLPKLLPISASIALRKMSCDSQPMLLNARVTPTAEPPLELVVAELIASMPDAFSACTCRSPPARTSLRVIVAWLLLSTLLVAIRPFSASPAPDSPSLTVVPLSAARSWAVSSAITVTS